MTGADSFFTQNDNFIANFPFFIIHIDSICPVFFYRCLMEIVLYIGGYRRDFNDVEYCTIHDVLHIILSTFTACVWIIE